MTLYLCAKCKTELLLELEPVEPKRAPEKKPCQFCGRAAYGDTYRVLEKRKEKNNGL